MHYRFKHKQLADNNIRFGYFRCPQLLPTLLIGAIPGYDFTLRHWHYLVTTRIRWRLPLQPLRRQLAAWTNLLATTNAPISTSKVLNLASSVALNATHALIGASGYDYHCQWHHALPTPATPTSTTLMMLLGPGYQWSTEPNRRTTRLVQIATALVRCSCA